MGWLDFLHLMQKCYYCAVPFPFQQSPALLPCLHELCCLACMQRMGSAQCPVCGLIHYSLAVDSGIEELAGEVAGLMRDTTLSEEKKEESAYKALTKLNLYMKTRLSTALSSSQNPISSALAPSENIRKDTSEPISDPASSTPVRNWQEKAVSELKLIRVDGTEGIGPWDCPMCGYVKVSEESWRCPGCNRVNFQMFGQLSRPLPDANVWPSGNEAATGYNNGISTMHSAVPPEYNGSPSVPDPKTEGLQSQPHNGSDSRPMRSALLLSGPKSLEREPKAGHYSSWPAAAGRPSQPLKRSRDNCGQCCSLS